MIYSCESCNYTTKDKSNFNKHLSSIIHSSTTKQKFMCECGKTYTFQSSLCKHRLKCLANKKNTCQQKDSILSKNDKKLANNLPKSNNEHELVSTLDKVSNFKKFITCGYCKKNYSTINNLKRHQIICNEKKLKEKEEEIKFNTTKELMSLIKESISQLQQTVS